MTTRNTKISFTKRALESLSIPEEKSITYHDTKNRWLKLLVATSGTKTFRNVRKVNGRMIRSTLGKFPEMTVEQARKKTNEINAVIDQGDNPNEIRALERSEATLNSLFDEYLDRYAMLHKKTWKTDQQQFIKHLHKLQNRKLSNISKRDIQQLHSYVGKNSGHYAANRILALLKAMFNKATEWGLWDKSNPCIGITQFKEKSRERFLQADEIPRFFASLAEEPNEAIRDYVLLSLLTGARRANILAMKWDELFFERKTWEIPETKNGSSHTVPLVEEALHVLQLRKQQAQSKWVFEGSGKTGHLVEPKKGWKRILNRANIENLRLHDLRRSLGSWQASTGASLSVIGKTLAHKNISTTAIYARLNLDPVRESMETATRAMFDNLPDGHANNVIKIKRNN